MNNRLSQTLEELRAIFYGTGDALIVTDTQKKVRRINLAAEKLTGWNETDIRGNDLEGVFRIIDEKSRGTADNRVEQVLREGVVVGLAQDTLLIAKDGTQIPIAGSGAPIRDDTGRITGVVLCFRDRTHQRAAQQELHRERLFSESIISSLPGIFYMFDETGKILRWNKNYEAVIGRSAEEIERIGPLDTVVDEEKMLAAQKLEEVFGGGTAHFEMNLLSKDGTRTPYILTGRRLEVDGKNCLIGVGHDITERKHAEDALRESEAKFRFMFENVTVGIGISDLSGKALAMNKAMSRITGYTFDEFSKINRSEIYVNPEDRKRLTDIAKRDGIVENFEVRLKRKEGETYWANFSAKKIKYEGKDAFLISLLDITERKQAEEERDKLQAQLSNAMEMARLGHWEYDITNDLFTFNAYFYKIFRTTAKQVGGYKMSSAEYARRFVHPDDMSVVEKETRKAIGSTDPHFSRQLEHRMLYADGTVGHISVQFFIVKDAQGRTVKTYGVNQDITERKQAEDARLESERRYRLLADNVRDVIWTRDMNLRLTYISPSVKDLLGYTVEEAMARTLEESWTPDSLKLVQKVLREELEIEQRAKKDLPRTRTIELEVKRKDGSTIWTEAKMSFLRDPNGRPTGIIGVTRDISERKSAELALRDSEEKYRTVLEANPDPVVVYDIEGKVIYFNPAFTRVFGWTLEERFGKKMDLFVPEEAWPETKIMIEKVLAGESFSGVETRRYNKKGEIIPVSISGAIHRDRDGYPLGSVINLRDISEQKRLEAQLQQSQKMESIGTLAGGIAHDFNNILSPIMGYAELALYNLPENSPLQNNIKEVLQGTKRASDLVKQILAVSRQSGQELKPLMVQLVIKEVLKLLRSSIPTTIEIKQNISTKCGYVLADPTQIHQIAMNLMTNAYQAMEDEGGKLEVTLKEVELGIDDLTDQSMTPGAYVCLTVADTGPGMDQSVISRIFEPYFTTKETGKGTGLGLAVVHGIVKSYNGDIKVYSEPGKGTAFHVYLPVIKSQVETERADGVAPVPKGKERILLVDDEEPIVRLEKQMLERLGYQVAARTSSIEALEAFRAAPDKFDLVITDMTMPNMTGVQLSQKLLEIRPDIPVIICTGFSTKIDDKKAKEFGMRGFVMKPVIMSELAKKIREVLEQD